MADRPELIVDRDACAHAGRLLGEAIVANEAARVAIPGGSALDALHAAVARAGAAWRDVRLTWVDERCVAFGHDDSNRGAAHRAHAWHDRPGLELPLYLDGETGEQAVERVRAAFERDFAGALDVVLLGMGPDGHVASLFEGWQRHEGPVAFVPDSPKPPAHRVTLTRAALATARTTLLLATGEAKRAALTRLLAGDASLPAHGLPGLVIVTDLDPDANPGVESDEEPGERNGHG